MIEYISHDKKMADTNECDHVLFADDRNHSIDEVRLRLIELENHEALMKLPAIIFIGVLLLIGLVGNFLVCIVYHLKFPPSTSKYFIMTLAVFDLLNCTIAIPAEMVDLRFDFHFNSPYVCRIMRFTISFSTAASACILLAIATDRYRKICHPFGKQMNSKQTKLGIILAITGALVVSWPAMVLYGRSTSVMEGLRVADCAFDDDMRNTPYPQIYISIMTAMCLTSVLTLIVLYTLIVLRVWKQKRARGRFQSPISNGPTTQRRSNFRFNCFEGLENRSESVESDIFSATQDQNDSTEKRKTHSYSVRTTVMLALVTAVFIISFIPFFVLQILKNAIPHFERNLHCNHPAMVSYKFFLRSIFLNSAVNPIIYSFCNRQFRTECRDFLGRICCSRPSDCSRPSSADDPIEIPDAERCEKADATVI